MGRRLSTSVTAHLTRDLINLDRMKKMKKSAIILNLGRGPIINEDDLYYALKNKIIASALWQKENRDKQYSYDYKIIKHKHHHCDNNDEYANIK